MGEQGGPDDRRAHGQGQRVAGGTDLGDEGADTSGAGGCQSGVNPSHGEPQERERPDQPEVCLEGATYPREGVEEARPHSPDHEAHAREQREPAEEDGGKGGQGGKREC